MKKYRKLVPFAICTMALVSAAESQQRPAWAPSGSPITQPGIGIATCAAPTEMFNPAIADFEDAAPSESYIMGVYDLRGLPDSAKTPPGSGSIVLTGDGWHHSAWNIQTMGSVFGITYDLPGNFYVAAHGLYSTDNGFSDFYNQYGSLEMGGVSQLQRASTIYRIDAITGEPTVFNQGAGNKLPQLFDSVYDDVASPGLGDITYDEKNDQFFVTNLEDGKIYRFDSTGTLMADVFDPMNPDDGAPGMPDQNELLWAVEVKDGKLYYSVWNDGYIEDLNDVVHLPSEIRCVQLDDSGKIIPSSDRFFYTVPPLDLSEQDHDQGGDVRYVILDGLEFPTADDYFLPVSDITFSNDGQTMLLSERLMVDGIIPYNHDGRVHVVKTFNDKPDLESTFLVGIGPAPSFYSSGGSYGGVDFAPNEGLVWSSGADLSEEEGPQGLQGTHTDDLPPPTSIVADRAIDEFFRVSYDSTFNQQAAGGVPTDIKGGGADLDIIQRPDGIHHVTQKQYLKPQQLHEGSRFGGGSVAIDGDVVVVGAGASPSSNSASNPTSIEGGIYIFRVDTQTGLLNQEAEIVLPDAANTGNQPQFGGGVAVSDDTVVVNGRGQFAIYVYDDLSASWSLQQTINYVSEFGLINLRGGFAIDGDTLVVGDTRIFSNTQGRVHILNRDGGVWTKDITLYASNGQPNDQFGTAVDISDGIIVVGATSEDSSSTGVNGDQQNDPPNSGSSGTSVGAAYVFEENLGNWVQTAYLKPTPAAGPNRTGFLSRTGFGISVSASGHTIAVGAFDEGGYRNAQKGAVYTFSNESGNWQPEQRITTGTNLSFVEFPRTFGTSVSLENDILAVGAGLFTNFPPAPPVDPSESTDRESVEIFERNSTGWSTRAVINPVVSEVGDALSAVALGGNLLVAGAGREDGGTSGGSADPNDNSLQDSGAVYVFDLCQEDENAVWAKNEETIRFENSTWNHAMGFHFTPLVSGKITHLGGYFDGTKTVKLFEKSSGSLLASTLVEGSNSFSYAAIPETVVQLGVEYTVAVYTEGSGASATDYKFRMFPQDIEYIRINAGTYAYTGNNPDARPTNNYLHRMYGQPDIKFVPDSL